MLVLWKDKQNWQTFNQTHQEKKRTQISKIRNEREVTTDTTEIQRIVRNYYEQLHANLLDNLHEMNKYLEINNLPKLNQEESWNLNRQITPSEIEALITKLPTTKQKSCTRWLHRWILPNIQRRLHYGREQQTFHSPEERSKDVLLSLPLESKVLL